jgi:hypothetical protein
LGKKVIKVYSEVRTLFRTYRVMGSPFLSISLGSGRLTKIVLRVGGRAAGVNQRLKKSFFSLSFSVGVAESEGGVCGGSIGKTGAMLALGLSGTILLAPYSESAAVVTVDDLFRPDILPGPNLNFEPLLLNVAFRFMLANSLLFFLPSAAASDRIDSAMTECAVLVVRNR